MTSSEEGDRLHQRGQAALSAGDSRQAVDLLRQAVALAPDNAGWQATLGLALLAESRPQEAMACFGHAIERDPNQVDAHYQCGLILLAQGRPGMALDHLRAVVRLAPRFPDAHRKLGNALQDLGQIEAAVASYDLAIGLNPDDAESLNNRGNALQRLGQWDASIASYDDAIRVAPGIADIHCNRGFVLRACGRMDEALKAYERVVAIDPDNADGHWFKGIVHLLRGDFEAGLPLYEWRWKTAEQAPTRREFRQPLWLGDQPVSGKRVLLHAEQGLGDTIQFARYAAQVSALGGQVILEAQAPLMRLLYGLGGVSEWVEKGKPLPDFDLHCPLLSLPLAFRTRVETVPWSGPYLSAGRSRIALWEKRLGSRRKPRVGLVWSGREIHSNDHNRSIELSTLLAGLPRGVEYVSLQQEVRDRDRQALEESGIRHFGPLIEDFTDTASLCMLVDVLISVDTSVAHLSGALGRPTWVLLPAVPDWRWLLDREDTPWYPTARLYRRSIGGDWTAVLARVSRDLAALQPDRGTGVIARLRNLFGSA